MPGNSIGKCFTVTTFGESHGPAIGVVIDGCPPGIPVSLKKIQAALDRRKPGQSHIVSLRKESDKVLILSGLYKDRTLGTPVAMVIHNEDARSEDYKNLENVFRPSHADYTYQVKYGIRDPRGGGRSSARETAARVAAGAVAMQILEYFSDIKILSWVSGIGNLKTNIDPDKVTSSMIDKNIVRCPDKHIARKMIRLIGTTTEKGDTVGGIIDCVIRNVPAGLGEPVFDKLPADFSKAIMSINAAKGFEWGSGFSSAEMYGSGYIDLFRKSSSGKLYTGTNNSGGVQGGISNGMDLFFRVAFHPVVTLGKEVRTYDNSGKKVKISPGGRHDPCVLPRAVPVVDAMSAIVLADHFLRWKGFNLRNPGK